jgi:hypothetical protein
MRSVSTDVPVRQSFRKTVFPSPTPQRPSLNPFFPPPPAATDGDKKKHLLHQALALADTAQKYYNLRIEFALTDVPKYTESVLQQFNQSNLENLTSGSQQISKDKFKEFKGKFSTDTVSHCEIYSLDTTRDKLAPMTASAALQRSKNVDRSVETIFFASTQ